MLRHNFVQYSLLEAYPKFIIYNLISEMKHKIENSKLQLSVKQTGAEICSLKSIKSGKEFIWEGKPEVWAGQAPILFPIVGALKEGVYKYEGKEYSLPQHGFMRFNKNVELLEKKENSLTFLLKSDKESLKVYPFDFKFITTYELKGNSVHIKHEVFNSSNKEIYFSLGEHPGFKCPLNDHEIYSDYYLEFETNENSKSWKVEDGGLIGTATFDVFNGGNIINLYPDIFEKDALVFKDLKSRKISLKSRKSKQVVTVRYDGYPFMGIWAIPNAPYVCIEPWIGIADSVNFDQEIVNKEAIIKLAAKDRFKAMFSIEIFE